MTEAARRNRFWNYDSPNCCNSGVLNNIHRTERKGWRKTALFLPAPESLSWEKNAVIHSVSKGCQEFVRRLIALTPASKGRIELAQGPGPGKRATRQVHNRNRTTSQVRDATELPYSVLPYHQSEDWSILFLADAVVSAH